MNCPGCGAQLPEPEGDGPQRCLGCPGEYAEAELSLGDFFELLAGAEDGPEKDWHAARLAEIGAEQVAEELGG